MNTTLPSRLRQHGSTMIEVLITLLIVAVGLMGLAAFQAKAQVGSIESYQRAQAIVIMNDMVSRINSNSANAASYIQANAIGTGDGASTDCSGITLRSARDVCEWSASLKGAGEQRNSANVGAMIGARGCVEQIQAPNATTGICLPGIYMVTVVWQGLHATKAPSQSCATGTMGSDDNFRRALSSRIVVGLSQCK